MKRILVFLAVAMMEWTILSAQTHQAFDVGYVFVTNLKTFSQQSLKSKVKSTINAGHVVIAGEDNQLIFHCVDVAESIVLGRGAFHKYYPPAQDMVPAEYISSAAFKKAVRKVNVYRQMPSGWELGKVYTFKPVAPNEYVKSITVRTLRLSSDDVTLVTEVDDNFLPSSSISISGETIAEITIGEEKVYMYDGQQIVLSRNDSGEYSYNALVVDDNGISYSQSEDGVRQMVSKLSYVFGEYPYLDYFGWISATEIIVDDLLYVATSPSAADM